MKVLCVTSRSCGVLLDPEGLYESREKRTLFLNGEEQGEEYRSVTSLFDLEPDTEYTLESRREDGQAETLTFRTKGEMCTLDVREFGAKGDGTTDDTAMLQAAILSCPEGGRVLVPAGNYVSGPLFLKSRMTLEIAAGATILLETDRTRFPILPESVPAENPDGEPPMNFARGKVENGAIAFGDQRVDLTGARQDIAELEGKEIVFGFRPEAVTLEAREKAARIDCRVELTEMLGDNTNVYITCGEQQAILKVDSHDTPETDEALSFYIPWESMYVFDGKTEEAL